MERVVAPVALEAHFHVIVHAVVLHQDIVELLAEVAFDLKDQAAHALCFIVRAVRENLFSKRQDAAGRFAAAYGPKNSQTREETPLRNDKPARVLHRLRPPGMMKLSDDKKEPVARCRLRVRGQLAARS